MLPFSELNIKQGSIPLEQPLYKEEGPWPVMGNIGSLLRQEQPNGNLAMCGNNTSINGGPNCTSAFNRDVYTKSDTCGSNCVVKEPESYGGSSFGLIDGARSSSYALNPLSNVRVGQPGVSNPKYGCMDWYPRLNNTDNCLPINDAYESSSVADWTKLPQSMFFK